MTLVNVKILGILQNDDGTMNIHIQKLNGDETTLRGCYQAPDAVYENDLKKHDSSYISVTFSYGG